VRKKRARERKGNLATYNLLEMMTAKDYEWENRR
jgi:hypothetical protein